MQRFPGLQATWAGSPENRFFVWGFILGIFDRLKQGLEKTRQKLTGSVDLLLGKGARLDDATLEDLETALLTADLGPDTTDEVLKLLRKRNSGQEGPELKLVLRDILAEILASHHPQGIDQWIDDKVSSPPQVILVTGVNGAGKTTTCGKLSSRWTSRGEKIMLAAADTFRAAAVEQLQAWAKKAGAEFFSQQQGADPAAVAYDAIQKSIKLGMDRVLIDTAGRLQAKDNLMQELAKVHRVCAKSLESAPHQSLLVLDGTAGQNMHSQVREFQKAAPLTGLIVTKLDGTARAGALVSICREFNLPIMMIGVGEALEDLQTFDPRSFASAMLGLE